MEMNRIQLFNVVVVCFTYVLHIFFCDVVFFFGGEQLIFSRRSALLERVCPPGLPLQVCCRIHPDESHHGTCTLSN